VVCIHDVIISLFMLEIMVHMLHPRSDMLQVSHANVSKLDPISMLQTLIFDAADVESRCRTHMLLGVANINI
jgi:hypothetical protein